MCTFFTSFPTTISHPWRESVAKEIWGVASGGRVKSYALLRGVGRRGILNVNFHRILWVLAVETAQSDLFLSLLV